jgi:hypothetical protein
VRRMREQKFETSDIARLVRRAADGDPRARERQVDQDVRASIPEVKRVAPLRAEPASTGSCWARWRYVSCLAKGPLGQGCT